MLLVQNKECVHKMRSFDWGFLCSQLSWFKNLKLAAQYTYDGDTHRIQTE